MRSSRVRSTILQITPGLSNAARTAWAVFLPVIWRGTDLRQQNGEPVPEAILNQWYASASTRVFDSFELRSKYNQRAVLGIRDRKSWLLARWSSYGGLTSWIEVLQNLKEEVDANTGHANLFCFCFSALSIVSALSDLYLRTLPTYEYQHSFGGFVIAGISAVLAVCCWLDRKTYLWWAVHDLETGNAQNS
jgi:hypothetical protein